MVEQVTGETICAISTALGGAVCILRVSGPAAQQISSRLWRGRVGLLEQRARELCLGTLLSSSGDVLDPSCLCVRMPGPHSYTGEDVVEFQCHGGSLCARLALESLLAVGCRLAEPGEFTKRAFLNGRIDLTQAEAVADVIEAGSELSLRLAGRQLAGHLGRRLRGLYEELEWVLSEVESRMDFPDEDLDWVDLDELQQRLDKVATEMEGLLRTRVEGEIMRGGLSLAIAGPPNVGKSSLLNRFLGRDRAIVSSEPGTTRDTVEAQLTMRGIPFRLVDTAGIRESENLVEQLGVQRSRSSAEDADLVLWVIDGSEEIQSQEIPADWACRGMVLKVANKSDLLSAPLPGWLMVSAKTGEGLEMLCDEVEKTVWSTTGGERTDDVAVAARHANLLEMALNQVKKAGIPLKANDWELLAIHLKDAMGQIGRITGQAVEPDVLETIFSRFCIGK
ncbi:MAG: tRNA uridine-5-carboxymethylaminomethyl(34) synthesis GTPase MnmE [Lentisphaerae bacterium]|jgi:tRNA modification GTPase|nr:tRNA uridine-5-carboxymethylaminomethyl(34) synthesis GTPase MnmE [Lentisphaerota bacterium]